jgi:hypothetical protein
MDFGIVVDLIIFMVAGIAVVHAANRAKSTEADSLARRSMHLAKQSYRNRTIIIIVILIKTEIIGFACNKRYFKVEIQFESVIASCYIVSVFIVDLEPGVIRGIGSKQISTADRGYKFIVSVNPFKKVNGMITYRSYLGTVADKLTYIANVVIIFVNVVVSRLAKVSVTVRTLDTKTVGCFIGYVVGFITVVNLANRAKRAKTSRITRRGMYATALSEIFLANRAEGAKTGCISDKGMLIAQLLHHKGTLTLLSVICKSKNVAYACFKLILKKEENALTAIIISIDVFPVVSVKMEQRVNFR